MRLVASRGMTVAALILPASAEEALTRIDGRPLVRRLVDAAWSGGAVPVMVAVADPAGDVAAALAGAPATLVPPSDLVGGVEAAVREVSETDAVMVWPTAYAWVDPETLTSLIEAHGVTLDAVLRPSYDGLAGWPVLLPVGVVPGSPDRPTDQTLEAALAAIEAPVHLLDLGDPGAVHDVRTPRADLPRYRGPAGPAGAAHEWGSLAAEEPDAPALEGPAVAPFGAAMDPD